MSRDKRTILILAPHTDDGELGCGGSIARFLEEGAAVYYAVFSTCEESVPDGFEKDVLTHELLNAMKHYGVSEEHVIFHHFPVRRLAEHRQEILDAMIRLRSSIDPDLVFAPSLHDVHQDHSTVATEAVRAFKKTSILGYEEPWNNLTFDNQVFVALEERHILSKIAAIGCYKSQQGRDYTSEEYTRGIAKTHGVQIGRPYAETFETVRWIV